MASWLWSAPFTRMGEWALGLACVLISERSAVGVTDIAMIPTFPALSTPTVGNAGWKFTPEILAVWLKAMTLIIVLLLTLVWLCPHTVQAQNNQSAFTNAVTIQYSKDTFDRIDALTSAEFAKHPAASVTVGVVSPSGLAWTKSYGFADIEKKVPASRDTVYRVGTITKQFSALMLLQLAERGKVHVSDPVEKYFPEVNRIAGKYPNAAPITLLQLAMHTSGICRDSDNAQDYSRSSLADWEKSLIAALPHAKYTAEPGCRTLRILHPRASAQPGCRSIVRGLHPAKYLRATRHAPHYA